MRGSGRVFRWDSVSRLSVSTVTNSKDVPCFMEVFVNSYTGGVSFLLECLQGLVSIPFYYCFSCRSLSGCVWVCVGVHAGCVCPACPAGSPLYIPVQTGVGVWFSRLSPDECIFCLWFPNKSVAVPFSRDVEWSLSLFPSLPPCPISPSLLLWSLIQMCLAQL